jgi:hypothetical protein
MGKRHRRIRARSATGQVAGAATEKPGLNTPIAQTGLPTMRSPTEPLSRSTEPTPDQPDQQPHTPFSCPEQQKRAVAELIGTSPAVKEVGTSSAVADGHGAVSSYGDR